MKILTDKVCEIPLEKIKFNLHNPRCKMKDIEVLAKSMQELGQITPVVGYYTDNGDFVLITGHRRVAAAKKLGWSTIKAIAIHKPQNIEEIGLITNDNLQKQIDLNDKILFYLQHRELFEGKTIEEKQIILGLNKGQIRDIEKILSFDDDIVAMVFEGKRRGDGKKISFSDLVDLYNSLEVLKKRNVEVSDDIIKFLVYEVLLKKNLGSEHPVRKIRKFFEQATEEEIKEFFVTGEFKRNIDDIDSLSVATALGMWLKTIQKMDKKTLRKMKVLKDFYNFLRFIFE